VLIMRGLSATGILCEIESTGPCPPPTPVSGPIAELRAVETGKVIWSLAGTATMFSNDGMPVISPDGRVALISMPSGLRQDNAAALIDMASGKVLQQVPSSGALASRFGFSADNRTAWVGGYDRLAYYHLDL
jgi:hypothetical protein